MSSVLRRLHRTAIVAPAAAMGRQQGRQRISKRQLGHTDHGGLLLYIGYVVAAGKACMVNIKASATYRHATAAASPRRL